MRTLAFTILLVSNTAVAEEVIPQAGTVFQDCASCPEMVVVPPGTFMMGSYVKEPSRAQELPLHKVTIRKSFAVGRFEITFEQWDACTADNGCNNYRPDEIGYRGPNEPGWGRGKRPVFRVSWQDSQSYIRWLNSKTKGGYRLLTEAEWEYMARAGTTTLYNTGDTISTQHANFTDKSTNYASKKGNWQKKTLPVGSFLPNAFGVYDVHGNVAEWVQDCWHNNYINAPDDGSAWVEERNCSERALRGGKWNSVSQGVRSAQRSTPGIGVPKQSVSYGFRIAKTLQ